MLAARMFGLGATWTSFHLFYGSKYVEYSIPANNDSYANPGIRRSVYCATKAAISSFARALNSLDLSAFNKKITGFI